MLDISMGKFHTLTSTSTSMCCPCAHTPHTPHSHHAHNATHATCHTHATHATARQATPRHATPRTPNATRTPRSPRHATRRHTTTPRHARNATMPCHARHATMQHHAHLRHAHHGTQEWRDTLDKLPPNDDPNALPPELKPQWGLLPTFVERRVHTRPDSSILAGVTNALENPPINPFTGACSRCPNIQ